MSVKENNEVTLKIDCNLKDFYKILAQKHFKIIENHTMDDTYFIPSDLNLKENTIREILAKAILIRHISGSNKDNKKFTFKIKSIDKYGNILKQSQVNCEVKSITDAKKFITAIGYKKIMNIKEKNFVFKNETFELTVKDIINGDKLIEIETDENNSKINTIRKLKNELTKSNLPLDYNDYFVKKAEIELSKILKRQF